MKILFPWQKRPEFTDGVIDLIPLRVPAPEPGLRFGREQIWRISLHGHRREIGQISYRDGESLPVFYYGHIGYHIQPEWQGHHYARRACLLVREAIRRSGKTSVIITCDPDNEPSRMTCEHLGCLLESIVHVPDHLREQFDISAVKCRYIWLTDRSTDPLPSPERPSEGKSEDDSNPDDSGSGCV